MGKIIYNSELVNGKYTGSLEGLTILDCDYEKITELPILPDSLNYIDCSKTQITELPTLPDSLAYFFCSDTKIKNSEKYFTNPQTNLLVVKQNGRYFAGCCCNKSESEFIEICKEKGFTEVLEHFNLK
jgi:Leucine-rich repeat (LRR) protein